MTGSRYTHGAHTNLMSVDVDVANVEAERCANVGPRFAEL